MPRHPSPVSTQLPADNNLLHKYESQIGKKDITRLKEMILSPLKTGDCKSGDNLTDKGSALMEFNSDVCGTIDIKDDRQLDKDKPLRKISTEILDIHDSNSEINVKSTSNLLQMNEKIDNSGFCSLLEPQGEVKSENCDRSIDLTETDIILDSNNSMDSCVIGVNSGHEQERTKKDINNSQRGNFTVSPPVKCVTATHKTQEECLGSQKAENCHLVSDCTHVYGCESETSTVSRHERVCDGFYTDNGQEGLSRNTDTVNTCLIDGEVCQDTEPDGIQEKIYKNDRRCTGRLSPMKVCQIHLNIYIFFLSVL